MTATGTGMAPRTKRPASRTPVKGALNIGEAMTAAGTGMDAQWADRAWRAGDTAAAIEVADHMLAADSDPNHLAASVAAAAAAADGALGESADRWRHVTEALPGVPGALAGGRAALAAGLIGDTEGATADLIAARKLIPGAAPRGLTVLFDAVEATTAAIRGEFPTAARALAGLAVATVAADPLAAERWDELAVAVTIAGGADRTAADMLTAHGDQPTTTRRRLLTAWLDLRAGRLADARAGLAAAAGASPTMRRDAVLAAAITVGLARRAGDDEALRATWYRVVPVISGADVEPLLLDAWGELSVGAALVSPAECTSIVTAMQTAIARAGRPAWALAVHAWWAVQRAAALDDPVDLIFDEFGAWFPVRAAAAQCWAVVLSGSCDPVAVRAAAQALAETGQPWEGAALCAAGARRLDDPVAARELLAAGRGMRATIVTAQASAGGLSTRERSVGELLLDGLTHKEIGARLYISPKTVEQHVARLRQKLLANNRSELVAALRVKLN